MLDRTHRSLRRATQQHQPSARAVVWLVTAIAVVSIATGLLAIITQPSVDADGTVGLLQSASEFSGTVLGFALLVTAWGMRRGYRLAYLVAAVLIVLAAAHGVVQSRLLSVPLVILSMGGLIVLAFTSARFTRSSALTPTQLGSLVAIVGVGCYGIAGAYALRHQFSELHTVVDAAYFTVVTASTVGYGDVHPTSEAGRLFAISLAILGPTTVAVAAGSLFGPGLQARLTRTGQRAAAHAREQTPHERIVVLGTAGPVSNVVAELASRESSVLVVTDSDDDDERIAGGQTGETTIITGDPTDEDVLESARLDEADAVLVATGQAARDSYAVLLARDRTDARIVAITDDASAGALERAGADVVLSPAQVLTNAAVDATLGAGENEAYSS
ncbi:TrkA-N domain-containing protein [Natrialba hulunbeirensis JCM 10989]|uniref:TrkA-N domain-containing protein n=1 Tax=Natrialba hulunbeirensis JCM 10989 TaxID=1227493 RepID=M0A589_9EURY|nr:NAD-binding protein [Natrialba hulunbeirensis]ELY93920.1 TrkA-N domain-containing protein [Natrialba hulunbeirensis JCM 10989]